jgi:hypothetical protein
MVAGGGAAGIVLRHELGLLHLARPDPADPDILVELAAVAAPVPSALGLSATRAALLSGRDVVVVDQTTSPPVSVAVTLSPLPLAACWAPAVVADGDWLLGSNGGSLELVQLSAPATRYAYAVRFGCATALLATPGAFIAFTTRGWVVVRPDRAAAGQPFSETTSNLLGTVRGAFAAGAQAMLAGEGAGGGSWVARVDLTGFELGVMSRIELDLPFGAFAWDGRATSVLQGLEAPVGASQRYGDGYVVREVGLGFRASPVALPAWGGSGCGVSSSGQVLCDVVPRDHLAAVEGRLYALTGPPYAAGWYAIR